MIMTLTPERDVDIPELARLADEFHLAPELLELLRLWGEWDPEGIGRLEALFKALGPAAVREEARRRKEWRKQDTGARPGGSAHPALRHATHPVASAPRPDRVPDRAVAHDFDRGTLLLTPVADFLLVSDASARRRSREPRSHPAGVREDLSGEVAVRVAADGLRRGQEGRSSTTTR
ncbi:hypothetical protein QF035_008715 [Streptomyces umbrinus]|uniref:Uncharacterized protein n=1 Tax=Streptomyces umbrinus TaxID=67370 RepID=A0ABU0T627_9ACTN|nr:hypothetical protein [Streptomyces umbrinus]MDQ1031133.1 hypothetical protein [Streptomyces umbrinus]